MTRIAVVAVLSILFGIGCGSSSKTIDTQSTLAALRSAGFHNLAVVSYKVGKSDATFIRTRGYRGTAVVEMPVSALRASSVSAAKNRLANDQRLLQGNLTPSERGLLPRDFDATRLREVRICNVVLASYNAANDAALTSRVRRAESLLRAAC
jgi:hypothetical protein